jgi:hypothetical protein
MMTSSHSRPPRSRHVAAVLLEAVAVLEAVRSRVAATHVSTDRESLTVSCASFCSLCLRFPLPRVSLAYLISFRLAASSVVVCRLPPPFPPMTVVAVCRRSRSRVAGSSRSEPVNGASTPQRPLRVVDL